jgi:hypothetical protein
MAKGPRREHSPLSAGSSFCDSEEIIAVAVATAAESVREGISTPTGRKEEAAVARAEERVVGVDSRREETTEGSRPGGGSIP